MPWILIFCVSLCLCFSLINLPLGVYYAKSKADFLLLFSHLSRVWLFVTPWTAARQASLSITNSRSLLRRMLSRWCHPAVSSSVAHFSSSSQSCPASGSLSVSQLSASDGQRIGALASVLPVNIHSCFPLGLTGLISLLRNSQEFSPAPRFENSFTLWLNFDWLSF